MAVWLHSLSDARALFLESAFAFMGRWRNKASQKDRNDRNVKESSGLECLDGSGLSTSKANPVIVVKSSNVCALCFAGRWGGGKGGRLADLNGSRAVAVLFSAAPLQNKTARGPKGQTSNRRAKETVPHGFRGSASTLLWRC